MSMLYEPTATASGCGRACDDARRGGRKGGGAGGAPRLRRAGCRDLNTISFMSANYVAREVGFAMHGWGHGDRATNDAFEPLETYGERFGQLLDAVVALGFDAVDIWGAHLNPEWASAEHVAAATAALDAR